MARRTHRVTRGPHRTVARHGAGSHVRMEMVRVSWWRWGYTAVAHGSRVGSHVARVSVRRWQRLVQLRVQPSGRVVGSRRGRRRRVGVRPRGHVWLLGVHVVTWRRHALHVHGPGAVQLVLGLGLRLGLSGSRCSVRPAQHPGLQLLQRQCASWCLGRLLQHLQEGAARRARLSARLRLLLRAQQASLLSCQSISHGVSVPIKQPNGLLLALQTVGTTAAMARPCGSCGLAGKDGRRAPKQPRGGLRRCCCAPSRRMRREQG